ncbi:MAG TPA: pitrilysin family protein [Gemmatimonadaceae bacterium]|nr:pitrilysin family protein [Gemmatimonadaceae bacterium]
MKLRTLLAAALLAVASSGVVAQKAPARADAAAINIPFERYTLPNGLTVILAQDHSVPRVAVDVWYHVGSKNEKAGRTGFAHMFEHVMFTGSGHVPYGTHDRYTEGVGGFNNGSTTNDRTNYYEEVPSNYLETNLWMESDRMGFLLDKLDEAKFVAQRDIVQNERRERTDNQPYGRSFEIITSQMLPESNPYSWPVVGYMSDLQHATVDDVKEFFRQYYAPNNATLAIVGDFNPAQARQWVTRYFADIPRGKPIERPAVTPVTMTEVRRVTFEDRVQVPRLYLAWPTVGEDSPDDKVLDIITSILTGPRTARLTRALVYDAQSAANVGAFEATNENWSQYFIQVTPRPGHSLTELEAQVDSVLERFKREGPTAEEMTKATAGTEYGFVSGLESNLSKAELLLRGSVFHGDAGYYKSLYAGITSVTAADVKRVANQYFTPGRVVLSVVPVGKANDAANAAVSRKVTVAADGGHYVVEGK